MQDDFLLQVNKPARYIGREWNVPRKDFDKSEIKIGLCFPDLYEVGMSNLGLRIIYGLLNSKPDIACERFFAPDMDMENLLRNSGKEIFSLESSRNLKDFDILGFSLGSELNYTNVLNILELGNVPLRADLRGANFPLIVGGGPCAVNPEPMHEFFDLFVIGEAEEAILEIINIYKKHKEEYKSSRLSKRDFLIKLAGIEGVYIPCLYEVTYSPEGKIEKFKPKIEGLPVKINKRFIKDFDNAYFPLDWLVPYIQIIHDRITLEITRGCPNTCRFCQARRQYYPFRIRKIENILNLASEAYKRTGYEEISLAGLSVSDYPNIEELLGKMILLFKEKAVSVALPSIKPKIMVGNLSSLIATIKKTGLTFAPEAGSERLRKILGKDFDLKDFFNTLEQAYAAGYQHVKLYFMIGVPNEEMEDLDAIVDFAVSVSELRRKVNGKPAQVNLSINALIPKPHTPFQWLKMQDLDNIKLKQDYLRAKTKNRRIKLSFHNRYMSFLEGMLSRGDRRLSKVIEAAFRKGARFDAWGNYFIFERWQAAFNECNLDYNLYLAGRPKDEALPWDFVDLGTDKDMMFEEFNKAIAV